MNKTVILILFVLSSTMGLAQFNQGRIMAGGSVGFSTSTDKRETPTSTNTVGNSTSFSFSPDVGYFVIDNVAVGAALGLSATKTKFEGTFTSTSNTTSATIIPFARYYLDQGIFFHGEIGGGKSKTKTEVAQQPPQPDDENGIFTWGLGVGFAKFLNDFVAVEPMVGYRKFSIKDKDSDIKDIDGGLYIRVALQVYLGARQ